MQFLKNSTMGTRGVDTSLNDHLQQACGPLEIGCVSGDKVGEYLEKPIRMELLSNVKSLTSNDADSYYAIKEDGSLWSWGNNNEYGALGHGQKDHNYYLPARVNGITDAKRVYSDGLRVFAVKGDGSLWAWGYQGFGALGLGAVNDPVLSPRKIEGISNVRDMELEDKTWAVTDDGSVYAWGSYKSWGPGEQQVQVPLKIDLPFKVVSLHSANDIIYMLADNGDIWTVQIREGTTVDKWQVKKVEGVSGINKIVMIDSEQDASFGSRVLAVKADGTLWQLSHVSLGNGTNVGEVKVERVDVTDVKDVFAPSMRYGDYDADYNVYAVKTDGTLWAWGHNEVGQLGNGTKKGEDDPASPVIPDKPVQVKIDVPIAKVFIAGTEHSSSTYVYALGTDGSVWEWGCVLLRMGMADAGKSVYTTPQLISALGTGDSAVKVNASLSFGGDQAWSNCAGDCPDKPTQGYYIGLKLGMVLRVTAIRPSGDSTPVSVDSAVVKLPDGLSFDKSEDVQVRDVKSLLKIYAGTDNPQGWGVKTASFDVYIRAGYVPKFTASGTVKTSVGEQRLSASLPVKALRGDYRLVRLVQSWYDDEDLASKLASFSDENVPGLWYNRLTLARRETGQSFGDQIMKYLDLAAQNDLSHAVFKDTKEAQNLLIALLDKLSKNLEGQVDEEVVNEFGDYAAGQFKQRASESDDPQDADFYSSMAELSDTAAGQFDLVNTPNTVNDWFDSMRKAFIEKQVKALPKDASEKLIAETRVGAGITYDVRMPKTLKDKKFIEGFLGEHGGVFGKVTDSIEIVSRLLQVLKDSKDIYDTWEMIRQIRAMGDYNQLYVDILKSISANATSETVRTAAANVADMIDTNTDHTVNDILIKIGQTATETGSIFELLAVAESDSAFLSIVNTTATDLNVITGKYFANSSSLAITMSLQTDIAYGLEKYYHASLEVFDKLVDPDIKLQRARKVFYSLFMLLNVHRDGETNVSSDKFIWSSLKVGSTTDKDGKTQDLTIKDQASTNVKVLDEILSQHVNISQQHTSEMKEDFEWYATWMCPVDVDVYRNGKLLTTLTAKGQTIDKDGDRFVSYTVDGDPKKLMILHGRPDEYSFKARGTDDGTLVFTTDVQSGGKRVTQRTSHLQVSKGAAFTVGKVGVDGTYMVDVDQNGDGTVDSQAGSVQVQSDKITVPTGISLSQKSLSLKAGETGSVGVTLDPAGVTMDGVTWSSSDPSVAAVDSNGRITGVTDGTATITATTFSKVSATLTLTVGKGETKSDPRKDLQQAIADAKKLDPSKYTPDSWKKLQDVVAKAEAMVKDNKATAQDLAKAKTDLDTARKELVENGSSRPSTPSEPSTPTEPSKPYVHYRLT